MTTNKSLLNQVFILEHRIAALEVDLIITNEDNARLRNLVQSLEAQVTELQRALEEVTELKNAYGGKS